MHTSERATADAKLTAAPIEPGASGSILPEFIRIPDVERLFGVKRGLCYRYIADGTFKSACIRKPGAATGIRLIHAGSVRDWLNAQLAK